MNGPDPGWTEPRKFVAPEIIFGSGVLDMIGRYALGYQSRHVLLVTDAGVRAAGWTQKAEASLQRADRRYSIFDSLTPNPKDYEIMAGADYYLRQRCDLIVAVGGGSVIDCAKGIGFVASNRRNILYLEDPVEAPAPRPPLICAPTTCSSGADVTQYCVPLDSRQRRKLTLINRQLVPDLTLVDAGVLSTLSDQFVAACGADILVHALEAYVSNAGSPITDMHALQAARLLAEHLPEEVKQPGDCRHREGLMLACEYAGLAFSNAGLGLIHAAAHTIGAFLDLAHTESLPTFIRAVVQYNYEAAEERYLEFGRALGLTYDGMDRSERKDAFLDRISGLIDHMGSGSSLKSLGIRGENVGRITQNILNDACVATNPREPTFEDVEQLLLALFD